MSFLSNIARPNIIVSLVLFVKLAESVLKTLVKINNSHIILISIKIRAIDTIKCKKTPILSLEIKIELVFSGTSIYSCVHMSLKLIF